MIFWWKIRRLEKIKTFMDESSTIRSITFSKIFTWCHFFFCKLLTLYFDQLNILLKKKKRFDSVQHFQYLCYMFSIGTQHSLESLSLFKEFGHGAQILPHILLWFLLFVEELGEMISESQLHLKATECSIKAEYKKKWQSDVCVMRTHMNVPKWPTNAAKTRQSRLTQLHGSEVVAEHQILWSLLSDMWQSWLLCCPIPYHKTWYSIKDTEKES